MRAGGRARRGVAHVVSRVGGGRRRGGAAAGAHMQRHQTQMLRAMLRASLLVTVLLASSHEAAPPRLTVGPPQPPHGRRNLLDPDGRQRLLRGVNIGVQWWAADGRPNDPALYVGGRCPSVNATTAPLNWRQPPVCGVEAVSAHHPHNPPPAPRGTTHCVAQPTPHHPPRVPALALLPNRSTLPVLPCLDESSHSHLRPAGQGTGKWNQSSAPLSRNDLAEIRSLGFNAVRLAIGWSSLEPEPGKVDETYIERIAQVVEWAEEQDVWVFIDLHQDGYSYFLPGDNGGGWNDGAPGWACPPLSAYNDSSIISAAEVKLVEKALGGPIPKSFFATEGFWQNRPPTGYPGDHIGLQERYIKAAAQVSNLQQTLTRRQCSCSDRAALGGRLSSDSSDLTRF